MKIINNIFKPKVKRPLAMFDLQEGQSAKITKFLDKTIEESCAKFGIFEGDSVEIYSKVIGGTMIKKGTNSPIGIRNKDLKSIQIKAELLLYQLKRGQKVLIKGFKDNSVSKMFGRMSIWPGKIVEIGERGMFNGPIWLKTKHSHPVAFRKNYLEKLIFQIIE